MGNGLYNQVVFGQLKPPCHPHSQTLGRSWSEEFRGLFADSSLRLESAYESEPDYLGVVVCSELAERGEDSLVCPYEALSLDDFVEAIRRPRPYLNARQEAWEMFRCAMRSDYGVEFEAGKLLWVSDYD